MVSAANLPYPHPATAAMPISRQEQDNQAAPSPDPAAPATCHRLTRLCSFLSKGSQNINFPLHRMPAWTQSSSLLLLGEGSSLISRRISGGRCIACAALENARINSNNLNCICILKIKATSIKIAFYHTNNLYLIKLCFFPILICTSFELRIQLHILLPRF